MWVYVWFVCLYTEWNWSRKNEDQLAVIVGHELAHAILGHSVGWKIS